MKEAILEYIVYENLWYESSGVTPIGQVARKFQIKKYEARKYIAELIKDGAIEYSVAPGGWIEDGPYPPLKGYKTSEKTKATELYKRAEKKQYDDFAKMCY